MHTTDSTDYGVVLSGNVMCELDDGAEVLLPPGDVVVQNGTRHRWRVVGDVPATLAVFIVGAHREAARQGSDSGAASVGGEDRASDVAGLG